MKELVTFGKTSLRVSPVGDERLETAGVTRDLTVRESETTLNASIQREPAVVVQADSDRVVVGGPVRVTVTDEYGNPVSGATVGAGDSEVGETDGNGEIRVPVESAGNVTISAESEGREDTVTVEGVQAGGGSTPTATATATATPSTDSPTETSTGFGPGFGITGALVAVLLGAIAARRRE